MTLLVLLAACESSLTVGDGPDDGVTHADEGPDEIEEIGDGPPVEDTGEREVVEFFDDTYIHNVAITLSVDAERALDRQPYEFVDGGVTVDGAVFPHVGIRLRGKIGSFRDLSGKPKFKIDFNHFDDDARLGEYEALALNNEVVDCSFLREPVGYAVFRQLGLPAARTTYTQVTVNGEDYGLYVGVEYPDDSFLRSRYADGSGNLYDGKYAYYSNGNYDLIDFTASQVGFFQLEEGVDNGLADVTAIADAVHADGSFAERLGPLLDTDEWHRYLAGEQWVGQLDGYALNTNNYRVYFDPSDGRADMLVYDLDYAFYPASSWGMNWAAPRGVVAAACWSEPECAAAQADAALDVAATVDTDALLAQIDTWTALIETAASDDPRRECGRRDIPSSQSGVRSWAEGASASLAAYWTGR